MLGGDLYINLCTCLLFCVPTAREKHNSTEDSHSVDTCFLSFPERWEIEFEDITGMMMVRNKM